VLLVSVFEATRKRNVVKNVQVNLGGFTFHSSEIGKLESVDSFGSIHEVGEIEARDVVSNYDVWVDLLNKLLPGVKHIYFIVEREYL
jgi:hypothetical protein